MKYFFNLLLVLLLAPAVSPAQGANIRQNLYVVHIDPSGKSAFKQKIYAYHFLNGSFTGREEIITVEGRREGRDYIRTDRGPNLLYKNRYLITAIGNIIDLKEKTVLFDGKASLVRCGNDSAIFYTNDVFKGKFYSVYNFKTRQYQEVKDLLFKPRPGRDVEFDKTVTPFRLCYYPVGKPKIVLTSDAGFGQQGLKDKTVPDPPMYWLDNDNFIYAHFNQANTELLINKLNVDSKQVTLLGKVSISKETSPAEITRRNDTQLILWLGNRQILIDLATSAVRALESSRPEHGFSYDFKAEAKGRLVKLHGREIGRHHFETHHFSTGDSTAAFVKELKIGHESYQQGLMVWNFSKQAWDHVDADEVLTLAGWARD
jgi:hypothetical protein